jgi:alcohol dehydrogenase, propanol-preferring
MRAAVLDAFGGDVTVRDVPQPEPTAGQVLVAVETCGVGLTLERARAGAFGGTTPRVVGHEIGGTVVATAPDVEDWQAGDRVTTSFYLTCGLCPMCAGGRETLCERFDGFVGTHVDGGLAEYAVLPSRNLVRVPDKLGLDVAGIVADAVATPYHVLTKRAPVVPGQTVAVIGAGGGIGVHMAAMAQAFGATVIAIERDARKERELRELGFDVVWNPGDEASWARRLAADLPSRVDVCVDTYASASTLRNGVDLVGRAGTFVVVGFQTGVSVELDPATLLFEEVVVTGSRYATRAEIAQTLELVAQGRVTPVIGARYPLERTAEAYRAMQANEVFGRILVECA